MPKAAPTQVIVHRLELQKSERLMLEEYMVHSRNAQYIKSLTPIATGAALFFVGSLVVKTALDIYKSMVSLDPLGTITDVINGSALDEIQEGGKQVLMALLKKEMQRRKDAGEPPLTPQQQFAFLWNLLVSQVGLTKAWVIWPQLGMRVTMNSTSTGPFDSTAKEGQWWNITNYF